MNGLPSPKLNVYQPKNPEVFGELGHTIQVFAFASVSVGQRISSGILVEFNQQFFLLRLAPGPKYVFQSPNLNLRIKYKFTTGKMELQLGNASSILTQTHEGVSPDCLRTLPIVASACFKEANLLQQLERVGLKDLFDDIVQRRYAGVEGAPDVKAIRREVENRKSQSKFGEHALMPLGAVLVLLGIGYFILPEFGYQFVIFETAPPAAAVVSIVLGFAAIIAGFILLVRANQN